MRNWVRAFEYNNERDVFVCVLRNLVMIWGRNWPCRDLRNAGFSRSTAVLDDMHGRA